MLVSLACTKSPVPSGHPVQLGEEQICTDPVVGFAHLRDDATAHGLVRSAVESGDELRDFSLAVGLSAVDLEGDGDIDVLLPVAGGFPQVFENDGRAVFVEKTQGVVLEGVQTSMTGFAAVDWNGDGLLDVILFGPRSVGVSLQQSGLVFGPVTTVYATTGSVLGVPISAAVGDANNDGALDLFLPRLDPAQATSDFETELTGFQDLLLLRSGQRLSLGVSLQGEGGAGVSMLGLFTDRDADGDLDLLVPSLRGGLGMPKTAFYRNTNSLDPAERFVDDAATVSASLGISGMGADSADLNRDGDLDYCITDLNGVRCLLSDNAGSYAEGAEALGLQLAPLASGQGWSGWSFDFADLNNDGWVEAVAVAGSTLSELGDGKEYAESKDHLWLGSEDGFSLDSSDVFSSSRPHYGLASADFDGDGALDLLVTGESGEIELYLNQCHGNAWTEVALAGPVGNELGLGARVYVRGHGRRQVREIHALRGFSQGPARAHFGLGDVGSIEQLTVVWPDGEISVSKDLPVNRRIRVPHPSRFVGVGDTADSNAAVDSGIAIPTARLEGRVSRSVAPSGDGVGELFVIVFESNPQENVGVPPLAWHAQAVDFSGEAAVADYVFEGLPVGEGPYFVASFLDDNASGLSAGPDGGDLVAVKDFGAFPMVDISEPGDYELDLDLNYVVPQ